MGRHNFYDMEYRYPLPDPSCKPDELIFQHDDVVAFYLKLLTSQKNHYWQGGDLCSPKRSFRRFVNKVLHPRTFAPGSDDVRAILWRLDDYGSCLSRSDAWDASQLLYKLSLCAVPYADDCPDIGEHRFMFFSESNKYNTLFPQLHVIWSENDSVAVFYAWGAASCFLPWAWSFQPLLAPKLDNLGEKIVVVVPSIRPITKALMDSLLHERSRIWQKQ